MAVEPLVTVRLDKPIVLRAADSDAIVSEITEIRVLREPVAGDLMDAEAAGFSTDGGVSLALNVAARICDLPSPTLIRRLSIPDALRLAEVVSGFFSGAGPQAGPDSSRSLPTSGDGAPPTYAH